MKIQVRELGEAEYPLWGELVAKSPQGSVYSLPEYLDILCGAGGGNFRILGAWKGEELVGGVGLYETKTASGLVISNRLLLYYNGIVLKKHSTHHPSDHTSFELEVLTALEDAFSNFPHARLLFHNRSTLSEYRPFLSRGWIVRPSYTYLVPLTNLAEQWEKIDKNLRRLIHRAEEAGLTLSEDDDFESFYQMHHETHRRKGAPLYLPKQAFQTYFERLRSLRLCRLYHARLSDGESASVQLVLASSHPVTHTVCAASSEKHLSIGASPFLRWNSFSVLSKEGFAGNDLTDAAINSVTRFKAQLGGTLQMTYVLTRRDSFHYRLVNFAAKVPKHLTTRLMTSAKLCETLWNSVLNKRINKHGVTQSCTEFGENSSREKITYD